MNKKRAYLGMAGAVALAVVLTACGGGGGGGSKSSSTTTTGTAAKGIISGAVVTAYRADGSEIGSAITAADGTYELSVKGYSGPVRLVLSPPEAPGVALVTCDAASCGPAGADDQDTDTDGTIEFGERYALSYELSAVVNVDKTATTVSAHITPLTTLVERRATAGGAVLQPETVAVANSFVKQMLGLDYDPTLVQPVDLTDPAVDATDTRALRYAVVNASFEHIVQLAALPMASLLDIFAEDFALNQVNAEVLFAVFQSVDAVADAVAAGNATIAGAVTTAASTAAANIEAAAENICTEGGACQVEVVIEGPVGTNLEAAKALVATARAVTFAAMDAIDDVIEPYLYDDTGEVILDVDTGEPVANPDYDANNTFAQIQQLTALNESTGYLTEAFGEVMTVVLSQAFNATASGEPHEANLKTAAGIFFDEDRAEDCSWYIEPDYTACVDANAAARAEFVARFDELSTIGNAGGTWSVTGATYTPTADLEVTPEAIDVDVALTLPASLDLAATTHVIGVAGEASSTGGRVTFEEAQATVTLAQALDLTAEEEGAPQLSSVSLDAQAEITDNTDTFSGGFGVQFAQSTAHRNLNPQSELNGLMPKRFSLNGTFTDGDSGNSLDIALTLNVTNAEQFRFYDEGYERNDLTTYSYNSADNSITITHGLAADQVKVKVTVGEASVDHVYLIAEQISATGDAWSPGYWHTETWGDGYWSTSDNMQACIDNDMDGLNGWFWLLQGDNCYEWVTGYNWDTSSLTTASARNDIRNWFRNSWAREQVLNQIFARVPDQGVYQAGANWDGNYDQYGEDINIFPSTSGSIVASIEEPDVDVNATNRYAKFDFTATVVGRLSEVLPEMEMTLTGNRTGYRVAVGQLTLAWGAESLIINYTENNGSTVTVTDGVGTTMSLTPGATDLEVGRIEKDGTVYGVITRELDGVYLVTWLDGDSIRSIETIN